jgi:peroxiredoxin (alkyl hydroperoxide reductase subunit C)
MATAVGKKFPDLNVDAMNEMGDTFKLNVLEEAVNNKKKVLLFWYPKDFTFVCPTELHAFQAALGEFEKRNTIVIGASCDTPEVHFAWLSTSKLRLISFKRVTDNMYLVYNKFSPLY